MKKLCYLLFLLLPISSFSQIEDSLYQAITEQGFNLMVIEPGEDPNGAQARPCGTVVFYLSTCCYVYQVVCGGEVKWQSSVFCKPDCSYFMVPRFIFPFGTHMTIPTTDNPLITQLPFDMSIILDKESLTEVELMELYGKYNHFYFELEENLLIEDGGLHVMLKAGNYTINQGEMTVKYHFATH